MTLHTTTVRYNSTGDLIGGIRINEPAGFAVRQIVPVDSIDEFSGNHWLVVFEYDPVSVCRDDFATLSEVDR